MSSYDKSERCGVLVFNNLPGYLDHPRGVKRPEAHCPIVAWTTETPIEKRWEICRRCQHYQKEVT